MYRGRFAPSPTGPLHFGSLIAAVGSYAQAKRQQGEWLVRMEDLDQPRTVPGAARDILYTLETLGLLWDGAVLYQSGRAAAYEAALQQLQERDLCYACGCSRREIADIAQAGIDGPVYPGTCRAGLAPGRSARAIRTRVDGAAIELHDLVQGTLKQELGTTVGDFVIKRADGLFAYQIAVVVDDAAQGITEIVRGSDLLSSTPRQIHLQQLLGLPTPSYMHLPVVINSQGQKLSKQTHAPAVDTRQPVQALRQAWRFLNQPVLDDLDDDDVTGFWTHAIASWDPQTIPRTMSYL